MKAEYDVIVVPGGGIKRKGDLALPSMCRAEYAADLYDQGVAPLLIPLGKRSYQINFIPKFLNAEGKEEEATIAGEMKKYWVTKRNIPAEKIILEDKSGDTITNFLNLKEILLKLGIKKIVVVISAYQRVRAEFLFNKIFGSGYIVKFENAKDGLSPSDLAIQHENEKVLLMKAQQSFAHIKDGDHEAIKASLITNKHDDFSKTSASRFWHSKVLSPFHRDDSSQEEEKKPRAAL